MKNPIVYTKEDIYKIVYLGNSLIYHCGGMGESMREFIRGLIDCLTPEEREHYEVVGFLHYYNREKSPDINKKE